MDVEVLDADAAISVCDQIISLVNTDLSKYLDTGANLSSIDSVWETNGVDKDKYKENFQINNDNLQTISDNINRLANAVKDYAQQLKNTSQKKSK